MCRYIFQYPHSFNRGNKVISRLTGSTLYFASDAIFFTSAKAGIIFIRCTSKEFLHFFMQQELNYVPYAIKNVPDRNILSVKDE